MSADIHALASELNRRLRTYAWMDFEVSEYVDGRLTVCGSISTSYPGDVFIVFDDVFMLSCPMCWRTDTSRDVFIALQGDDYLTAKERFIVYDGYHIFRFEPEDFPGIGCYVAAKQLHWTEQRDELPPLDCGR